MSRPQRRSVAAVALAVCVPMMVAACGTVAGSAGESLRVGTSDAIGGTDGDMAALQGRLEGRANGDGSACFWIDGPNGRAFLILRSGSYATADLELHEAGAAVVARVGSTFLFSGAPDRPTEVPGCPGTGTPWNTGQISMPRPDYSNATLQPAKTSAPD